MPHEQDNENRDDTDDYHPATSALLISLSYVVFAAFAVSYVLYIVM